jgi:hypothetical protein
MGTTTVAPTPTKAKVRANHPGSRKMIATVVAAGEQEFQHSYT